MMRGKSPQKRGVAVVFGVFDLLHQGHLSFFDQASRHGNLVAIVARDSTVLKFKKRKPHHSEKIRLKAVRKMPEVKKAMLGDKIRGTYGVLKKIKPDVICLGYDQNELGKDICARVKRGELPRMKIIRLKSHEPKKFKTSIVAGRLFKNRIQSK